MAAFLQGALIVLGSTLAYLLGMALFAFVIQAIGLAIYRFRKQREGRRPGAPTFNAVLSRMRRAAQPTLLLTPARSPGFSKLGGLPELPEGVAWPAGARSPRAFLGQIDLGAFRAHAGPEWLPAEGRLYLFVDEERYGFADLVSVSYSLEPPGGEAPRPPGLQRRFDERRVAFVEMTSVPSLDWLGLDAAELSVTDDELDLLADLPDDPFGDEVQHRIGGYPSEIQSSQMQVECEYLRRGLDPDWEDMPDAIRRASKRWRLLVQIDSDPALKMNWGDGGRLYVFVRKTDAEKGDFSRTVTLWQTY